MWIPTSVQELEAAVRSGSLEETEIFDAKKEITTKNIEIAKDIAAMANEGGVLIYGIDEDEHKRPTILNPIPLAKEPERIDAIVQTSIAESPRVSISTLATEKDPSRGYVIVAVPASERAPHMVVVKGDHRYYGRTATGNAPLTEGQVARLYERRTRWEVDRDAMLAAEVAKAPARSHPDLAYLHVVAQPVSRNDNLFDKALRPGQTRQRLIFDLVTNVAEPEVFVADYHPDFYAQIQWQLRVDGVLGKMGMNDNPLHTLDLQVDFNGSGHLFCGGAARRVQQNLVLFPSVIAGNTTRFLTLLSWLYDRARYIGMVDIGIALSGLAGCLIEQRNIISAMSTKPYDQDEYRRTARISAQTLKDDPRSVARQLLMPLFDAMTQGSLDPFR